MGMNTTQVFSINKDDEQLFNQANKDGASRTQYNSLCFSLFLEERVCFLISK